MTRDDVLQAYMTLGGVPYYLNLFKKGLSVAQNIDRLFYGREAKLEGEYDYLVSSIFKNAQMHKRILELPAENRLGYSKKEIAEKLNITDNGEFYNTLTALEKNDFIMEYHPYGNNENRGALMRLKDSLCLFWLHFHLMHDTVQEDYWLHNHNSTEVRTWQGYAFEDVCFNHILQLKKAPGISGVNANISSLTIKEDKRTAGMQIDLLITRDDNVINLCEMIYTKSPFIVDKAYYETMKSRIDSFMNISSNKSVHLTLISPHGIKTNEYSSIFQSLIMMDDLFN